MRYCRAAQWLRLHVDCDFGLQLSTPAPRVAGGCCAYTQRTYPNGHVLGGRGSTAPTGPSQPHLLLWRIRFYRAIWRVLPGFSQAPCSAATQSNSISFSQKLLLQLRAYARLPCCPATPLVSHRTTRPSCGTTQATRCPATRGYGPHDFLHQFARRIQASNAADPSLNDDDNAHLRHCFSAYL